MEITYPTQFAGASAAFSLDCSSYPLDLPESELPAECDEGYDPNWDPTELENDVAALLAATDAVENDWASVTAVAANTFTPLALAMFSRPPFGPTSRFPLLPGPALLSDCNEAEAMLTVALVSVGFWAAMTVYYGFRRNPLKAYRNFLALSASAGAVLVAKGKLDDCEDPQ